MSPSASRDSLVGVDDVDEDRKLRLAVLLDANLAIESAHFRRGRTLLHYAVALNDHVLAELLLQRNRGALPGTRYDN